MQKRLPSTICSRQHPLVPTRWRAAGPDPAAEPSLEFHSLRRLAFSGTDRLICTQETPVWYFPLPGSASAPPSQGPCASDPTSPVPGLGCGVAWHVAHSLLPWAQHRASLPPRGVVPAWCNVSADLVPLGEDQVRWGHLSPKVTKLVACM